MVLFWQVSMKHIIIVMFPFAWMGLQFRHDKAVVAEAAEAALDKAREEIGRGKGVPFSSGVGKGSPCSGGASSGQASRTHISYQDCIDWELKLVMTFSGACSKPYLNRCERWAN